jgi:hypothetical protein
LWSGLAGLYGNNRVDVSVSAGKRPLMEQKSIDTFFVKRYYFQATAPAVYSGHHPFFFIRETVK